MGTGYTRNDTSNNIADGNVINAADLDGEFDAIESAFNSSTGHTHDGTSAEGAPIEVLGPSQDVVITASVMRPKTTNTVDLGTSSLLYKDAFIDGTATIGGIVIDNDGTIGSASDTDAITISSSGIVTFSQAPIVDTESATTNSIINTLILRAQSSGTPAVGIGTGMRFEVETAAGNVEQGAAIRAVTTSLTPTDEEIDLVFLSMQNGSLVEAFRYDSTNDQLDVSGSIKIGSAQELKSNGTIKISADSDASGSGTINFKTNDVLRVGIQNNGDTYFYEDTGATIKMDWDATNEYLHFRDDVKAVFGTGADLQIYHDASNSYISDAGTGELKLTSNGTGITFEKADGTEIFDVTTAGATKLYYNGSEKLATTSGGVDITGSTVNITGTQAATTLAIESTDEGAADGPVLDLYRNSSSPVADDDLGRIDFSGENDADTKIIYARIESYLEDPTNASEDGRMRLLVESNGTNTSFIDLDASQGGADGRILFNAGGADIDFIVEGDTDSSLFVTDASTNNVGISIATPLEQLHVQDAIRIESATPRLRFAETDGTADQNFQMQVASGNFKIQKNTDAFDNAATRFDMDQSGNVAISSNGTAADTDARLLLRQTDGQVGLRIVNEDGDATSDPILDIDRDSSTPANDDNLGRINFSGRNNADEKLSFARIEGQIKDVTDGTEDGNLKFLVRANGNISEKMRVTESGLSVNLTGASDAPLHVKSGGNDAVIIAESDDADATEGPQVWLRRDSASPANNDWLGVIKFRGNDSAGTETNYFEIAARANDVTDGSEQGYMRFLQTVAGLQINVLTFNGIETVFNENGNDKNFRVESSANSHMLFVDAGNNRIGINEDTPDSILHIRGDGGDDVKIIIEEETNPRGNYIGVEGADELVIAADEDNLGTDSMIRFRVDAQERVRMTNTAVIVNEGSYDVDFRVESDNDDAAFFVSGSDGNVGMSVTDPSSHIPVSHNSGKRSFVNFFSGGTQFVAGRSDTAVAAGDYCGGYLFKTNDTSGTKFGGMIATADDTTGNAGLEFYPISNAYENQDEGAMQLDDTGDLYLRTGGIRVGRSHENVYSSTEEAIIIYHAGAGANDTITRMQVRDGTGGDHVFLHQRRGTIKSEIEENGDFLSATNSYGSTSDERLKENIEASGSQWDDIKALQVKKYSMKDDNLDAPNMLGVIAQDLQASGMNGLVKTHIIKDAEDNPILDDDGNEQNFLSVKYSVLYMKAIKALQEAMTKIESLETENTAIKARLDALET